MKNNYYFDDIEQSLPVGNAEFKKESISYLNSEYNYTLGQLLEEFDLSDDDLKEIYEEGMSAKEFINFIMEDSGFNKQNYYNIILSGGRNLAP